MQEMKYFNEGNDCDICKNQLMTGRDGTVEDCRRRQKVLTTMQSGETCQCYGYYTDVSGVKWLYVAYKNVVGFASSKYLKK